MVATAFNDSAESLRQHGKSKQRIARADDQVLCALEFIGDGRVAHTRTKVCVPQGLTCRCIDRDEVVRRIARENQIAGGGEHA
jgi:hypothetical protein